LTIDPTTTLRELAFIVGAALADAGTIAVLSGGGAATVYAPESNQSRDLDFILGFRSALMGASKQPLIDLGFEERGATFYHPAIPFSVEFPAGPLAIGDELITEWDTLEENQRVLNILTPTDCVRDRLAWFVYYNDFRAVDQAVAVAARQPFHLDVVRDWCGREGAAQKFDVFMARLHRANQKGD
jgi:hypothetical protein